MWMDTVFPLHFLTVYRRIETILTKQRERGVSMENYGILSLLPVAVVIVLVLLTRRTASSLVAGTVVGAVLLYGTGFPKPWLDVVYGVMGSDLWIWLVLVCGFFGSLVSLFEASGGTQAFTTLAGKLCKGERSTLLGTWVLGMVIFVDDWLSILSTGNAMRKATDKLNIPREMLAYLCNSTASSICVVVPTSTWGVFMVSQLVATDLCTPEQGIATFLSTIPFLFYPLITLLCGGLYAAGILPVFGPMKAAYLRERGEKQGSGGGEDAQQEAKLSGIWNFLLPVILITAITIATGEILYGTLACLVFCAVLYLPQKLMKPGVYLVHVVSGFKDMVGVLFIVTSAFILRDINSLLGMPEYVIGAAKAAVSPQLLPVVAFLLVTALAVAAGNFWGICAIAFPVIIPIAQALDGNLLLTAGAIISATAAGSHICFFGSEATLTCSATQIDNVTYAKTVIPMLAVPVLLSAAMYVGAGMLLG